MIYIGFSPDLPQVLSAWAHKSTGYGTDEEDIKAEKEKKERGLRRLC